MNHTLVPADVPHYYQRLAELSTLPFRRCHPTIAAAYQMLFPGEKVLFQAEEEV